MGLLAQRKWLILAFNNNSTAIAMNMSSYKQLRHDNFKVLETEYYLCVGD